ncbi:Cadmium, zinc and cobalt-transporting ATPase [Fusobacterium sp. DD29]|uniref:heavy metal translocating P-type ATPase n=1 Tax=unclassified Fusobacterium TaxID=2648384 RepID=UPI001B8A9E20|nr:MULTISPECIES: heavy metal translocating P-type ATPase [unclassified Fusobacterium]MBR8700896.1 Cadmium, zinc and cobalt-transporting ATPase [Fusobacterium sp. DD45]MBR8710676.1 Cadmium, zinc and cobalt-transporting ATPase [Fusobacterium sp. DD28]MBR8749150.1 Cadmium, zinc and cobalt-transporting ATPase [Fusobacterium sp. DD29]MBR8751276.1 Cadmium, zinc and cobalt-transporting ATPase [Fusobacterium sp. DD26]MBR8761416.1 Cadmium, zinc and cobalt-transporting ATPase [Fusobacterium sp. DD25]
MTKFEYEVLNLDCAGCAGKIQDKASNMKGVKEATINLYKKRFVVEADGDYDEHNFLKEINIFADAIEPGTKILPLSDNLFEEENNDKIEDEEKAGKKELFLIIFGVVAFIASIVAGYYSETTKLSLAIFAYLILGIDVIVHSLKNLNKGNFMDENFLMTIATLGAFYLGETNEAVGVMLFYKIGEFFQSKAVSNSRKSIKKLLDIRPEYANILNGAGELIQVSPKTLKINDLIIVKSGEKIPVDGIITKGTSSLNTSALTGESLPVDVTIGDNVLSGSLNGNGTLEIRVTTLFQNSTVSKIIEMVENAGNKKAKAEKFITKFARYYTPIVVILALTVGLGIPLIFGNFNMWFGRALIFLVISCPCALVLSVPLTFFSSIGQASKQGILIKGGNYLEALNYVDAVVFDKTGTLTKGKFAIDRIEAVGTDEKDLLKTAQIGEFYSSHPIGKAILQQKDRGIDETLINGYNELSGFGVTSYYNNQIIMVGNYELMKKYNIKAEEKEYPGTIIYVARDNEFLGYIYISDEIKEDSAETISSLKKYGIESFMLTGDNASIGKSVGEKLKIQLSNIFTNLLPQDKVAKLEEIKASHKNNVVFVGDGVNDAPVLSLADIGIAMGGSGSDIAVESADVVIMKDEPSKISDLLKIAHINKKVVMENIVFALGVKIIVMILGVFGIANMWMAIFADVGVSLLAVINSSWGVNRYFKK